MNFLSKKYMKNIIPRVKKSMYGFQNFLYIFIKKKKNL